MSPGSIGGRCQRRLCTRRSERNTACPQLSPTDRCGFDGELDINRMNATERIELAKAYVALSNAHRLELILSLFADQATYHSPHVGEFKGKAAIGEMMAEFFSRFPDVHWNTYEYTCTENEAVEFEFQMAAIEALTGRNIERGGIERIEFTDEGHIFRLEVRNRQSQSL